MAINAHEFDEIARNIFAPAYPLLAGQIVSATGLSKGACLDVGSGGGYLGLALASVTDLQVWLLDECEDNRNIAEENICQRDLAGRVRALTGDVHAIPLGDGSIDLVVSRSSLFFWKNPDVAFREIRRVLAPGGSAYIGGGFGSKELRCRIEEQMSRRSPDWRPKFDERQDDDFFVAHLRSAGIEDFRITRDESGFWISFPK
ncbi:class I SAM-dependent methyltransferase [Geobacter sp. FeAm09]|uniref:class I SAM-dependent methyltransferase n=1 Tax=Geobacter sp. FeAm09 TaxID=2597769 RepID=UPI0011EDB0AD|nr:class I SAM-dependent methyltransferase [Geobacter sp. FeAm09]QEM68960.1 class I SAM-dependent methyltransferase [Geobacter sp. FeAm09]